MSTDKCQTWNDDVLNKWIPDIQIPERKGEHVKNGIMNQIETITGIGKTGNKVVYFGLAADLSQFNSTYQSYSNYKGIDDILSIRRDINSEQSNNACEEDDR